ncbi:MAG: hypothetical protein PHC39_04680 [Proteiniphilum sp.]|nr:hypothetical protein [Proteiniphilum sp.]
MKYKCKWCNCDIEITQSEKAKTGMKKLDDHEGSCFRRLNPNFESIMRKVTELPLMKRPERDDVEATIKYLHESLGKIPSEGRVLKFHMFLQTNPSDKECEDFVILMRKLA